MIRSVFRILSCVLVAALSPEVLAQSPAQQIAIRIHTLSSLRDRTNSVFEAAARFLQDEEMIAAAKTGRELLTTRKYRWDDPKEFDPFVGRVYLVDSLGRLSTCSFRSATNHAQFQKFLAAEKIRRGDDTRIEGDDYKVKLTNPEPPEPPPGKPKIRYVDSYYHYDNGIVFHGALGHSLNSTLVLEAIKRARDKDTYIEVKPQEIDSAFRKTFLQRLTATAYVQMQRRDGEELSPFSARRALQQNHIDLITAILFETQSLVACEKMPSNDGPYQASATLIAKDGTQLRKFIDQLRSGSLTTPPMTNERLISLAADFKLPDLVAPTATALLNNSSFSQSALSDVLRDTIENRGVSVAATVDLRSDTGPTLSASADVSRTELSAEEIAASMGEDKSQATNGPVR